MRLGKLWVKIIICQVLIVTNSRAIFYETLGVVIACGVGVIGCGVKNHRKLKMLNSETEHGFIQLHKRLAEQKKMIAALAAYSDASMPRVKAIAMEARSWGGAEMNFSNEQLVSSIDESDEEAQESSEDSFKELPAFPKESFEKRFVV